MLGTGLLKRLSLGKKFTVLVCAPLVGLVVFGSVAYVMQNRVKVNGPLYGQIIEGKDLVADVLPPPAFMIESWLNALQLIDASERGADKATIARFVETAHRLRTEYEQRHAFWAERLPKGDLATGLLATSYAPAQKFFTVRDGEFLAAIGAANVERAKQIARTQLEPLYAEHRAAIDRVVSLANAANQDVERDAGAMVSRSGWMLLIVCVATMVASALLAAGIARMISRPVIAMTRAATAIAEGDLRQSVVVDSGDELGTMASAFARMTEYLRGMAQSAEAIAAGDLTRQVGAVGPHDTLGHAFVAMVTRLRGLVGSVATATQSVDGAAHELAAAAEQAGTAAAQIATAIHQLANGNAEQTRTLTTTTSSVQQMRASIDGVASGAQAQAASVKRASELTADLDGTIDRVAGNVRSGAEKAQLAAHEARTAAGTVAEAIKGMDGIRRQVDLLGTKVNQTVQQAGQIATTIDLIDDIASQTNLLALNAAIEAQRAGAHGRGFSVVADEVRQLAERSAEAAQEIAQLVRGIQRVADEAVRAMKESVREVEQGITNAKRSNDALDSILKAVAAVQRDSADSLQFVERTTALSHEVAELMKTVAEVARRNTSETGSMAANSGAVGEAMQSLAGVSEESSAVATEVSASVEEMSAQTREVASQAQVLATMALGLKDAVGQFRLSA